MLFFRCKTHLCGVPILLFLYQGDMYSIHHKHKGGTEHISTQSLEGGVPKETASIIPTRYPKRDKFIKQVRQLLQQNDITKEEIIETTILHYTFPVACCIPLYYNVHNQTLDVPTTTKKHLLYLPYRLTIESPLTEQFSVSSKTISKYVLHYLKEIAPVPQKPIPVYTEQQTLSGTIHSMDASKEYNNQPKRIPKDQLTIIAQSNARIRRWPTMYTTTQNAPICEAYHITYYPESHLLIAARIKEIYQYRNEILV